MLCRGRHAKWSHRKVQCAFIAPELRFQLMQHSILGSEHNNGAYKNPRMD